MKTNFTISRTVLGISPFLIIGVFLVLVPIFIYLTVDNIRALNNRVVEHFTGKGEALIRSLEAGTRTGVMALRWEGAKVQRLLMEMALQSGIEYIFITDQQGKILAHSDPGRVGMIYDNFPNIDGVKDLDSVQHRQVALKDATRVFEVYKRFSPARPPGPGDRLRGLMDRLPPHMREQFPDDWCRMHFFQNQDNGPPHDIEQFVFAGFNMERIEAAKKKHITRTVLTGTILFFIGCAGMVSLFTVQAYRSARTSLVKVKAFSDEVVANMPAGLLTIGADHTITSCNKSAADMFGLSMPAVQGADPAILPPAIKNIVDHLFATGQSLSTEVENPE